jgi:hypothetical protein
VKKFFAILLLVSFSVQVTGYHLFFHLRQAAIKKSATNRIERALEEDLVEEFVVTPAEATTLLQWEGDKEFRYKGEMYDLVDQKAENGKIHIRCISDRKETSLVKNYRKMANDDFGGSSKKRASLLLKLIATFYTAAVNPAMEYRPFPGKISWVAYQSRLSSAIPEILTPPPQFA